MRIRTVTTHTLWFALVIVLMTSMTGAAAEQAANSNNYTIGPEDILDIAVWKNTDLSRTVLVRPDGMISLPLLNDIQAAGVTPMALRAVLVEKLKEYIPEPEVSVIVEDVKSFKVSVLGEVGQPGRLELRSRTTILDALALAGGLKEFAKRSRVVVLRPSGNTMTRLAFDYEKVTEEGGEGGNFFLHPDDIIVVP